MIPWLGYNLSINKLMGLWTQAEECLSSFARSAATTASAIWLSRATNPGEVEALVGGTSLPWI